MTTMMARKGEAEKRAWKLEMNLAKVVKDLEDCVEAYNSAMAELSLQPIISRVLAQHNLHLRVDSQNAEEPLSHNLKTQVHPLIVGLHEKIEIETRQMGNERLQVDDAMAKMGEAAAEKTEDCTTIERRIALVDQQYATDKEVHVCVK